MTTNTHDRREFLGRTCKGLAGMTLAASLQSARSYAANDAIRIGCIGTGGRCRQLMNTLKAIPGVELAAVCDVWDVHMAEGIKIAGEGAFTTRHYEEILERNDIDAVLVGTPDHWHVPITIDACKAGKDVYVEKPLTHDLSEGEAVIKTQNETKQIVQVGMQQRSMPHLIQAKDIVDSGELGEIRKVHLTWNRNTPRGQKREYNIPLDTVDWERFVGPAPSQPFDAYRFRNWRFFWDFGGGIFTDLMVHYIDVAHWFLGLDHPENAVSIGNHFTNEFWQTPDTVQTLLQYEDPATQIYFEGTFFNARNAAMMEFMGSEATLYCDRGRYEVIPERNKQVAYRELILGSGPRGADFYDKPDGELLHLTNWIDCIRSRKQPNAPAEAGVSAAAAAHLANNALRKEKFARW